MTTAELISWIRKWLTDADTAELPDSRIIEVADDVIRDAVREYDTWHSQDSYSTNVSSKNTEYFTKPTYLRAPTAVYHVRGSAKTELAQVMGVSPTRFLESDIADESFMIWGQRVYFKNITPANLDTMLVEGYFFPHSIERETNAWMTDAHDYVKWGTLGQITIYDFEDERSPGFLLKAERLIKKIHAASQTARLSASRPQGMWGT